MTTKNAPGFLHYLVGKWIAKDELTSAIWEIQACQDDSESVLVSGTLNVNIDNQTRMLKVTSSTHDDEESIGRTLQALNESLLRVLQTLE